MQIIPLNVVLAVEGRPRHGTLFVHRHGYFESFATKGSDYFHPAGFFDLL
jgi:hypothetical protein